MATTLTAADIMTREVVTVPPDASLREVANLLVERNISGVPVVSREGELLGIVSETDLINSEKRRVRLPRTSLFGLLPIADDLIREAYDEGSNLTARDLMTTRLHTLPVHTPAQEVVNALVARRVNRIPILDGGRLVGIVTRNDALRALQKEWAERGES